MSYVYVLSNPAMPGLVKIGFTDGDVPNRARELSSATGVPVPFFIEFMMESDGADLLEQFVHAELAAFRVNHNREFFRAPARFASDAIERIATSEEFWVSHMMRLWSAACPEARAEFLRRTRAPVSA